jgi:hypothetical protein
LTCVSTKNKCTSCDKAKLRHLDSSNACPCDFGYFDNGVDIQCESIKINNNLAKNALIIAKHAQHPKAIVYRAWRLTSDKC